LRDIVVIGGSAGSIDALRTVLRDLPGDFSASIFVVVHLSPNFPSALDSQISHWARLPAFQPMDYDPIRRSCIYIARPDHHMTLEGRRIRVLHGPRENGHRPAIDALFRTAAREYGRRVVGVILSGLLDDGSAGLYAVKERGGIAIVQDPDDAEWQEMPHRAFEYANPQYVLQTREIAPTLVKLVNSAQGGTEMSNRRSVKKSGKGKQSVISTKPDENLRTVYSDEGVGVPSVFACPECHGVLWELKDKDLVRFRCRVGHSYGPISLTKELSAASEGALWAAMRALEEKAAMQRRVADRLGGEKASVTRLLDQSKADDVNARLIRDMIFDRDKKLETEEESKDQRRKAA
jgi:two-component system, chemotaxis family, protein-glutamate methylesterase/glutaminase